LAKIGQVLTAIFWIIGIPFAYYISNTYNLHGIEGIMLTFLAIGFIYAEWEFMEIEKMAEWEEHNLI